MIRTFRPTAVRAVLLFSVVCSLATAQAPPDPPKPTPPPDSKAAPTQDAKSNGPAATSPPTSPAPITRPGGNRDASVDRRLSALTRLQKLMTEKIKLAPEQQKKIESMFDDYMGGLFNTDFPPHVQPRSQDLAVPQDLPMLKKELAQAEKDGQDQEKIASLRAKIYAAKIVLEPCIVDEPVFFFRYLHRELNDEQRPQFDVVLKRWQMLRPPEIAPEDDFKQLRRSTRDPELRDSEELGKKLDELIVTAYRTVPLGPQRLDPAVMKELAATTKPKVLELLTPPQREHLEKTLAMLKHWAEEDPDLAKKARERLKDHKPSLTWDQEAQAPASGAGAVP